MTPHVSETAGYIASVVGTTMGAIYLQVDKINFKAELFNPFLAFGITMCVVGAGIMTVIAAMEKYNKYRAKVDDKLYLENEKLIREQKENK